MLSIDAKADESSSLLNTVLARAFWESFSWLLNLVTSDVAAAKPLTRSTLKPTKPPAAAPLFPPTAKPAIAPPDAPSSPGILRPEAASPAPAPLSVAPAFFFLFLSVANFCLRFSARIIASSFTELAAF